MEDAETRIFSTSQPLHTAREDVRPWRINALVGRANVPVSRRKTFLARQSLFSAMSARTLAPREPG